jgi:hypothetical protein
MHSWHDDEPAQPPSLGINDRQLGYFCRHPAGALIPARLTATVSWIFDKVLAVVSEPAVT